MDLEKDYVEYVAEFSLALLAVSAAYFFDPLTPLTYITLALVPMLFGYTAYISRDGFSHSSLLGLIALVFVPISYTLAAVALVTSIGNVLVSAFAGGSYFRDYYASTTIPLLLVGLLLGGSVFVAATSNPGFADSIRSTSADIVGNGAQKMVENADLVESQKQARLQLITQTSELTVTATELHVLNQTSGDLDAGQRESVEAAFESAEKEVPSTVSEEAGNRINQTQVDVKAATSGLVNSTLQGRAFLLLVPLGAVILYSLQPVIGLLTAIFAYLFSLMERPEE